MSWQQGPESGLPSSTVYVFYSALIMEERETRKLNHSFFTPQLASTAKARVT